MEYIVIIAVIVIVLAIAFLRKKEEPSDYEEPVFKASGKKWVFNGILDIDNPPSETTPFEEDGIELQLMVKKGFVHYEMSVEQNVQPPLPIGMFRGRAYAEDGVVRIYVDSRLVGSLSVHLTELYRKIAQNQDGTEAYGFIGRRENGLWGEVCVRK